MPLRSISGELAASELLRESALRRDIAYGGHKDLIEEFQPVQGHSTAQRLLCRNWLREKQS